MKRILSSLLFLSVATYAVSATITTPRATIERLTSADYWGRGYTRNGIAKAAVYLSTELRAIGVEPLVGEDYYQPFTFPVNTFPGDLDVKLNGRALVPGVDFLVTPPSQGRVGGGTLLKKDETHYANEAGDVLVTFADKLTWSVARKVNPTTEIIVDRARFTEAPENFELRIENEFIEAFPTANLAGVVRGTSEPDRYLVLSAHYDHLGGMGRDTFFPGANDNASGVALLLELARFYATHPPKLSVIFLFFSAEEAGLIGSKYFVEHPLIELSKIRFLMNFDLVGTGDEGATVVNATEFAAEFKLLQDLNAAGGYLSVIHPRGKAPNSDHYWFAEKGVPAFFLYTMGGVKAYHDVYDVAATLPLTKFEEVKNLLIQFFAKIETP